MHKRVDRPSSINFFFQQVLTKHTCGSSEFVLAPGLDNMSGLVPVLKKLPNQLG